MYILKQQTDAVQTSNNNIASRTTVGSRGSPSNVDVFVFEGSVVSSRSLLLGCRARARTEDVFLRGRQ